MTYAEISEMIAEIGVPYAYYQFSEATAKPPPFICFFYPDHDDFYADNNNFAEVVTLRIELYTDNKDFSLENVVENVLRIHEMTWQKSETFLDSERMYETIYEMEVVIQNGG